MPKGVLLSLFLIASCILAQIVLSHRLRPRSTFIILVELFVASVLVYVLVYALTPPTLGFLPEAYNQTPFPLGLFGGLLVYSLLYGTYVQFFYYLSTPLTFRILEEFLKSGGGFLTLSELKERYGLSHVIRGRLETLVTNGYIQNEKGHLRVTRKGKIFAILFKLLRGFLGAPYYLSLS